MPTGNKVEIVEATGVGGGRTVPVAFTSKFEIHQAGGVDAQVAVLPVHKDNLSDLQDIITTQLNTFDKAWVSLRFTTSDATPDGGHVFEWKSNWFIREIAQDPELDDVVLVTISDVREAWRGRKHTKKYNLYYDDGSADAESLNSGSPWTVGDYIESVMNSFGTAGERGLGIEYAADPGMDASILAKEVPRNLSNSINYSGGWLSATLAEVLEPVMKAFGITIMPSPDGKVYVTDTAYARTDIENLIPGESTNIGMEGSFSGTTFSEYERPDEIALRFEIKREILLETLAGTASTPYPAPLLDNVMKLPKDIEGATPDFEWKPLGQWAADSVWDSESIPARFRSNPDAYLAERYFKDQVIPYQYDSHTLGGNQVKFRKGDSHKVDYLNSAVSEDFRRTYKVSLGSNAQRWSRIRLGRITSEGGTKAAGNVICDYVRIRNYGIVNDTAEGGRQILANTVWTDDIAFSDARHQPAPFVAAWADEAELILKLFVSDINRLIYKDVVPGRIDEPLGIQNAVELEQDGDADQDSPQTLSIGKPNGSLRGGEPRLPKIRVIATATPQEEGEREKTETATVFAGAKGGTLSLKAYGVTANYKLSDSQLQETGLVGHGTELINGTQLSDIATRVAAEVKASYERDKIGAVKCGGVEPLSEHSIYAGGACNEMWIEVGGEQEFSITTNYSIRPGGIIVTLGRKDLDGEPVRIAL